VQLDATVRSLPQAEARFAALVSAVTEGVAITGPDGRVITANDAAGRILGRTPDELRADGLGEVGEPAAAALRTGVAQYREPIVTRHSSGAQRFCVVTAVPLLGEDGEPGSVLSTFVDVTTERERDAALRHNEEQFRLAMEHTPVGFALVDLDGRFLRVNRALCKLVGYHADELRDRTIGDLAHPDDVAEITHHVRSMLRGERDSVELEPRCVRRSGETIWTLLSVALLRREGTEPQYLIVQIQDVTEHRRTTDLLTHLALHDPLTGLPHRTLVLDRIQKALDRGRRTGRHVAVLFCDIDHFKVINDSMGHELGDAVLVEVSRRLVGALRTSDTAGRLGGDEFVVVCEDVTDESEAIVVAERVQAAVGGPALVAGRTVVPTLSVGIVDSTSPDVDPLTLLRDADASMYRAKDSGRNRWDLVDVALRRRAMDRLDIEHALRASLTAGGLRLHFQPIVDLTSGRPVGHEALLRWRHPTRGLLPPGDFLHVAEESGLIDAIGRWVLRAATSAAAATGPDGGYVAVNVSARQVARPGLADSVAAMLGATGLPPDRLVVELTESVMLGGAPAARHELAQLDDLGVRLVVDDFGTGFSALSYLRDLPVSGIKVDRSFTAGLGVDHQCERIVEALMGLGRGLGMDVVVEGVENARQREVLAGIGCEHAQGFLFGRPAPHFAP
jgi:diguanylate cyclase (GGDEF)-like protein/PAS domain S-box-containing protein